jgi:hypothetical protein
MALLCVGLLLSLFSAFLVEIATQSRTALPEGAFVGCVIATVSGLVVFRRKTRPWKIRFDAETWDIERTLRNQHPTFAAWRRRAKRMLIWLPSVIAAGALFFLPVATHVVHPFGRYLPHYHVPIPWNISVFTFPGWYGQSTFVAIASNTSLGRLGVTPFWDFHELSSEMSFTATDAATEPCEVTPTAETDGVTRREFKIGRAVLFCRQRPYRSIGGTQWTDIACEATPLPLQSRLSAAFVGSDRDTPIFYRILEGIRPIK